jgi:di/tricarboxylate transporter
MNWEAWVTLLTVGLILYGLARNFAAPDVILVGGLTLLMSLSAISDRFPSPAQSAAVFGNEGLLTVGVLFVVAAGLVETGGLTLISERLLGRPQSVGQAQARLMPPVAGLSAFLNNTPVVAMFLPIVNEWSRKHRLSTSKLLLPLSYAAVLGGTCTLIGTSTNLVVQGLLIEARRTDPAVPVMGMFTIGAVGLPAAVLGIGYILLVSRWLLPNRESAGVRLSNPREYTVEMLVEPRSSVDGLTIERAGLRHLPGMYLAGIERAGESIVAVGPEEVLRGNDRLLFVGVVDSVVDLKKVRGLVPATDQVFKLTAPRHNRCLIEAVVSDTCPLIGKSIREGQFRSRYDAAVIAVHRNGERVNQKIGDIVLKPGDTLLLESHPRFLRHHRNNRDFFLVSAVADSHPRRHERAWIAIAILAGMVTVVAVANISVFNAALVAAALMGLTRCCSAEHARRSINWSTLVAIGAALGVGRATETTGLAAAAAQTLIGVVEPLGPWGALLGIYVVTLLFTELVTNNAAAALAFPIAMATAAGLDVNVMPFAIAIAMAASAGFATPLGYQTHLMVYGPGGYRFTDFVKIGVPLDILVMIVTLVVVPMVFPFR